MLQGLHLTTSTLMTTSNCRFRHHNSVATADARDVYSPFVLFAKWRRLAYKLLVTVNSVPGMKETRSFKNLFLPFNKIKKTRKL